MIKSEIQTRSEINGLNHFFSIKEAFAAAERDESIWKISFLLNNEQVRLVRAEGNTWEFKLISLSLEKSELTQQS